MSEAQASPNADAVMVHTNSNAIWEAAKTPAVEIPDGEVFYMLDDEICLDGMFTLEQLKVIVSGAEAIIELRKEKAAQ